MDDLNFRAFYDKGIKLYREGKLFEARSYLRRAYLIWPWNQRLAKLISEIEEKLLNESKSFTNLKEE
ncbi:MAG: hypothetical protein QMD82_03375 [bacterium]|nr:hypothetical protein [bacterium]